MNDDTISRQAAISVLCSQCTVDKPETCLTQCDDVYKLLNLPSVQQWIPVSDRLPEVDEDVLVSVHFKGLKNTSPNGWNDHIKESWYVDIANYYAEEWHSYSDEYKVAKKRHEVIAWMPLPKPYKEVDR